jgi:hypothetical protein
MSLPYIDAKNGRPSDMIAYLQNIVEQQERVIDILKGALATHGIEAFSVVEHWGDVRLTPQESALVGALYAVFPKAINRYQLLELLPGQDRVKERTITTVGVVVHKVRAKLGKDAIESQRGRVGDGYRLGPRIYDLGKQSQVEVAQALHLHRASLTRKAA